MTSRPMVLVTAATRDYVMPLAAMMQSVLAHSDPRRALVLHVLTDGISDLDREKLLSSWPAGRLTVHWLVVSGGSLPSVPLWGRMHPSTYFRLLMPSLLSDTVAKAVWLDSDLIVRHDAFALWDLDVSSNSALAVQDLVVPYVSSRYGVAGYAALGLPERAPYFNAGVMVVNLDWWRQHDVATRVFAYLSAHRKSTCFWDQEGLNAALAGTWAPLDARWNQIASVSGRRFFSPQHLTPETYALVVNDPWIVHYAGTWKPWSYENRNPSRQLYYNYLDSTAWRGWRPAKTIRRRALGFYESTLRSVFYPLEVCGMKLLRMTTPSS